MRKNTYTKDQIRKLILVFLNSNRSDIKNLCNLLYSGLINYSDTFNKDCDLYNDSNIEFIINSSVCCLADYSLTKKEQRLWKIIEDFYKYS